MPSRLVKATIDLRQYQRNLEHLRSLLPASTEIMAILKANAYGHGDVALAEAAQAIGITQFGVVCPYEARRFRDAGIHSTITLIDYLDPLSFPEALALHLSITLMDQEGVEELIKLCTKKKQHPSVHLKVDTGMHRAGCDPSEALTLAKRIVDSKVLHLEGLFTHLADADNTDSTYTLHQLSVFDGVIRELSSHHIHPRFIHAANSDALKRYPQSHYTMVRPGFATFMDPPILRLTSEVVYLRSIQKGESVGYGCTFTAKRPSIIALIPIGYGDGFRRSPHTNGSVLIHGFHAPIIGRISMDQTTVDVTDIPGVCLHDEVVIIGKQGKEEITPAQLGEQFETSAYEVLTGLTERVHREYVQDAR